MVENQNDDFLNKGIGTKEPESLKPAKVQVQGVRLVEKKKSGTETVVGKLITLVCKHPDKVETIELSNVKTLTNEKVKMSALWYNLDEDGNLNKRSVASELLRHYGCPSFGELVGKELETTVQSENSSYLCIKAY